jgi:hypothetical protein
MTVIEYIKKSIEILSQHYSSDEREDKELEDLVLEGKKLLETLEKE